MSPVISADVSEDMAEQVEELREEGESRSQAIKRLIRAGMKWEDANGFVVTPRALVAVFGAFLALPAYVDAEPSSGLAGLTIIAAALVHYLYKRVPAVIAHYRDSNPNTQ